MSLQSVLTKIANVNPVTFRKHKMLLFNMLENLGEGKIKL